MNVPETLKSAHKDLPRNKDLVKKLKKVKKNQLDDLFHHHHQEVFAKTDCLSCANCCITTGPRVTDIDIDRISRQLRLKPGQFIEQYLRIDEDNDYVFKSMPCPFLGTDNHCSIYEFRPKACREYPHTDRRNMGQILNLTLRNTLVCPAVYRIFAAIEKELK
jgi:Fe-S-cluster containining protein